MEQKLKRGLVLIVTALLAVGAYLLRQQQLRTAYDETGMIRRGAGSGFFTWFTIAVVVLLAVYALFLSRRKTYAAAVSRSPVAATGICLGAFGVLAGSLMVYFAPDKATDRLLALGSLFTSVCWLAMAVGGLQGKRLHPLLYFPPVLAYGARLALDFRALSSDPVILDYCYELLALIFTLGALVELGAFAFDRGKRRVTVFFTLGGIFFCAASLAEASLSDAALTGGALVYLFTNAWVLLRPGKAQS